MNNLSKHLQIVESIHKIAMIYKFDVDFIDGNIILYTIPYENILVEKNDDCLNIVDEFTEFVNNSLSELDIITIPSFGKITIKLKERNMWSYNDDGIFRPFRYLVNCVTHDGTFIQRRDIIFVASETVGFELLDTWNKRAKYRARVSTYPLYEYRKV